MSPFTSYALPMMMLPATADVSPWNSLTTFTLVVSLLALVASLVALLQRSWFNPKPFIWPEWSDEASYRDDIPTRKLVIYNHGMSAAQHVRLFVKHMPEGHNLLVQAAVLENGQSYIWVDVPTKEAEYITTGYGQMLIGFGEGREIRPDVILRWRQHPFMWWDRRRMIRAPRTRAVSIDLDPDRTKRL